MRTATQIAQAAKINYFDMFGMTMAPDAVDLIYEFNLTTVEVLWEREDLLSNGEYDSILFAIENQ